MSVAESIQPIDLAQAARERYLRYAMSVITSRALPDCRDGLKPVQRRILYAMDHDLHLRPTGKPVKSAKVVGQVMSNYHPHGDSAIYDAMVRMAQPFALRYPLVDGQGNFGAITGDDAAAFRYTEARLRTMGSELMEVLGEETVDERPSYDESTTEPIVLPTPAPLLLLNGSTGIAVGMSTNIPPHNLEEVTKACVQLIDKPDTSITQLLRSIKGPDFPTGAELLATREDLRGIYESGAGTVKVQGTYVVETPELEKRQRVQRKHIVITSVPYGVSTGQVLAKIRELVEAKKLPQIAGASDQTNEEEGVRIVLELKTSDIDVDPALIMAAIYRLTPLRTNYSIHLTGLLPAENGVLVPRRHVDLKTLLQAWLDFRFEVVTRSLEYRKRRLEERIHILQGLAKVLGSVTEAIKLIRASKDKEDARKKLMKRFKLSEIQANAVLEIQLYRLAQLEVKKVKDELAEKKKAHAALVRLLKGSKPRWNLIKKDLTALAKRHGDGRRTRIILGGLDEEHAFDPDALIRKEDAHVVLTAAGRLKRQRNLEDVEKIRVREDDSVFAILQGSTLAHVAFFTDQGSAYVMKINDVPQTHGFGEPIQKFFNFSDGEKVLFALSLDPRVLEAGDDATLLVAMAGGNLVRVPLAPHTEPSTRSGRKFVRLGKGDEVVSVELPAPRSRYAIVATNKGRALRVRLADVSAVAGVGKGKRGLRLDKKKKELVVAATSREFVELETTRGGVQKLKQKKLEVGEVGDPPEEQIRFGFRRALPPALVLYELPEEVE